ncbi:MAG TPA: hypothetical protein VGL77_06110 [Armatimonadota bacterium]
MATIKRKKLFRLKDGSTSLLVYCRQYWGLSPRTVHQKMAVYAAYTNIRACTDDLPVNEAQVRPLLVLRSPEQQQQAWHEAITRRDVHGVPLTAKLVSQAVRSIQTKAAVALPSIISPSTTFTGIPWRLDVLTINADADAPQSRFDPRRLLELRGKLPPNNARSPASSLVMVSPTEDLFANTDWAVLRDDLNQLLVSMPYYTFLLWTAFSSAARSWKHGANVELTFRVGLQCELDQIVDDMRQKRLRSALWLLPEEPLVLPELDSCARLVISAPRCSSSQIDTSMAWIRSLVASALRTGLPVHLDAAARGALTRVPSRVPATVSATLGGAAKPRISHSILQTLSEPGESRNTSSIRWKEWGL